MTKMSPDSLQQEAIGGLASVTDAADLEAWRIRFLGSKGRLKALMSGIKAVPAAERGAFGKAANAVRQALQAAYEARLAELDAAREARPAFGPVDFTEPGLPPRLGRRHVISRTIGELTDVFKGMGFTVATGPEVEDTWHNFDALNISEDHPARDPADNFYLAATQTPLEEGAGTSPHLLRSQTSTVQIRMLERQPPPLRIISTGRVYRPDEHDATHYSMFHQVEGLCVDQGVTMVDLKSTLYRFAKAMFGPDADVRLVPSYFPFTEPSAELYVKMDVGRGIEWVEIGGCGMVDPAVFEAVGLDPEVWTGFAFGLGIERLAMRRYGIRDIRWLFENDLRFLRGV